MSKLAPTLRNIIMQLWREPTAQSTIVEELTVAASLAETSELLSTLCDIPQNGCRSGLLAFGQQPVATVSLRLKGWPTLCMHRHL